MAASMRFLAFVLAFLVAACGPNAKDPSEVVVFAAASLTDVLQGLAAPAERDLGVRLVFNFAGSGDLTRQIAAGAPADVFFSADEEWMDRLARAGRIDPATRVSFLTNRLVIVVPADREGAGFTLQDLSGAAVRRLALADPDSVPAGRYAREWLAARGVWTSLADRIVPALDVRAALAAVETGAVDAGIVYRTDALGTRRVRVVFEVPEEEALRISYPVAVIAGTSRHEAASRLVQWLASERAEEVFRRSGFGVEGGGHRP